MFSNVLVQQDLIFLDLLSNYFLQTCEILGQLKISLHLIKDSCKSNLHLVGVTTYHAAPMHRHQMRLFASVISLSLYNSIKLALLLSALSCEEIKDQKVKIWA